MKTPMRTRPAAYGLLVVEVICPSTPHVHLPIERHPAPTMREHLLAVGVPAEFIEHLVEPPPPQAPERVDDSVLEPWQRRAKREREARRSPQPFGWDDRVYQSVSGLRWRCCRNLFEEGHTPWCPAGVSLDPLPPA